MAVCTLSRFRFLLSNTGKVSVIGRVRQQRCLSPGLCRLKSSTWTLHHKRLRSPGKMRLWRSHLDCLVIRAATASHPIVSFTHPSSPHLSRRSPGTFFTGRFCSSIHSNASFRKLTPSTFHVPEISPSFNASKIVPALWPLFMVSKDRLFVLGILGGKVRLSLLFKPLLLSQKTRYVLNK